MKSVFSHNKEFCNKHFKALALRAVCALRRLRRFPEGIGEGTSSSVFSDVGTTVHACPPNNNAAQQNNKTNKTKIKTINTLKPKTIHSLKNRVANLTPHLTTLTLLFFTSCSSTCHIRSDVRLLLDEENAVLNSLKEERADGNLAKRVKNDGVLSRAELHLKKAIQTLIESNKMLQTVF